MLGGSLGQEPALVRRQRPLDRLEHLVLEHRHGRLGPRERHIPRIGSHRSERGEARRSGQARRAPDHHDVPGRVLVVLRAPPGHELEDLPRHARMLGVGRLEPDVDHLQVAGEVRAGRHVVPDLLAVEGDRQVRVDRHARHLAGRRVDARRDIYRDDVGAGPVDLLDQLSRAGARLAAEARAEERVDDQGRLAEILLLVLGLRVHDEHLASFLLEHTRRHPPVAAVRAGPADDRERARVAEVLERVLGDGATGPLHQLLDCSGVPLLRRSHLRGGVEGLKHRGRRPGKPRSQDPSSATSRDRSRPRERVRPRPWSDPRGEPPVLAGPRSRSPAM